MIRLAPWMHSSLPKHWHIKDSEFLKRSGLVEQKISAPLKFGTPVKELTSQLGEHVSGLFGLMKQRAGNKRVQLLACAETPEFNVDAKPPIVKSLIHTSKTPVVQATKYLVEANKKGLLPHPITVEEFNTTAIEIVDFLEQIASQVSRRTKIAGAEILTFSQDALFNSNKSNKPMDINSFIKPGQCKNIFHLAQGALRYIDLSCFFFDSQNQDPGLYSHCITMLTKMVMQGVENEKTLVGAKKKGLSF